MADLEKVIKGLEWIIQNDKFGFGENWDSGEPQCDEEKAGKIIWDAIALLKEQEGYVSVPFSWLVKFCTHIDFVEPLTDAEREVAWKQKLKQQFGINVSKRR